MAAKPKKPPKAKPYEKTDVFAVTVSGSGDSYKKAVNHAIDNAKSYHWDNLDMERSGSETKVKIDLTVTSHQVTHLWEQYCYEDDKPSHYVTMGGTITVTYWHTPTG